MEYLGSHAVAIAVIAFIYMLVVIVAFVIVLLMFRQVVKGKKGLLPTSKTAGLPMGEPQGGEKNAEEFAMQQMAAAQYGAPYGGPQYGGQQYSGAPQYGQQYPPPQAGFAGPGMYPEKQ